MSQAGLELVREPEALVARPLGAGRAGGTVGSIHLLGPGAVGRAFLHRVAHSHRRLVAVTDSTATIHDARGLKPEAVIAWKSAGRALREWPGAEALALPAALERADAGLIVDATATNPNRPEWADALQTALENGAALAFAAKDAMCRAAGTWLSEAYRTRVGCNAVLGGTGGAFVHELPELRPRFQSAALVGNASTTAIIERLEQGGTMDDGIRDAAARGFLETNPELDLRGVDAAVKLAIVAGALLERVFDPTTIPCQDIRSLDPALVQARTRRGCTTRLVARAQADGQLGVAYEEVSVNSALAAPIGSVAYIYQLAPRERRIHVGAGLGADATAEALWVDVCALGAQLERPPLAAGGVR